MDGQPGRWGWWWRNAPRAWARGGESGKPGEHCRPPGKTGEQTREPAPPVGRDDPRAPRGDPPPATLLTLLVAGPRSTQRSLPCVWRPLAAEKGVNHPGLRRGRPQPQRCVRLTVGLQPACGSSSLQAGRPPPPSWVPHSLGCCPRPCLLTPPGA
ncbi:uncharacterized protein PS065_017414 isoform 1-T1 [Dugong dugon]